MKKIFVFILLLGHVNSSMLLPQVAQEDVFDINGQQLDDINTVFEYVDQVILGHTDTTPEDENDDTGQNFHLAKVIDYVYQQSYVLIAQPEAISPANKKFSAYNENKIISANYDIITPPPET